MRPLTKGCVPLLSPLTKHGWSRGVRICSSGRWASTVARHTGQVTPCPPLGATCAPRLGTTGLNSRGMLLGGIQVRTLKKANYVEKMGDNEKVEELLESLEVRDDKKDTQPQLSMSEKNAKRAEEMSKGKMLTTPSRLFKLIIPLTTIDTKGNNDKGIEPIAILVHPQQPLSYLEQLIQSELPPIEGEKQNLRPPTISFIALQHEDNAIKPKKRVEDLESTVETEQQEGGPLRRRRSHEEDAEIYSYPRKTDTSLDSLDGKPERFVRWSQATEVGDFIRDAARTREFIVSIEGAPSGLGEIRVTVPSFNERTYFLRMRMRKLSRRIQAIAEIKHKCDELAQRGAQRVAIGGFGILSVWWYSVYKLTFETDLGWDTMEPVTYLVSLSTLMGGYLWFLYHNREISYKSALDFTVNARQKKLYQQHNIDLQLWETLIDEGKSLRREIRGIAAEYDAEWNERVDEQDEMVTEALRSNRKDEENKDSKEKDNKEKDSD